MSMTEEGLAVRVNAMLCDIRDSNDARAYAEHSHVELCACGAYTITAPCSKCRREALANALTNGKPNPTAKKP
jgi:hypothetical protein